MGKNNLKAITYSKEKILVLDTGIFSFISAY